MIQVVHRVLTLAVYPAKLFPVHPLPRGFLPKVKDDKAKSYLYPDEDAKLMACVDVPLLYRLYYGVLSREGARASELIELPWSNVDLDRGVLHLDRNKTDEPIAWALDPGVAEALRRWRKRYVPNAPLDFPVFSDARWRRIERFGLADGLRNYLRAAGVDRPQLFDRSSQRIPLRAHDLRATFVTVNLALGRSETWISDRTGHKSSTMIHRYKRAARSHAELNLGPLVPLHEAIPELRDA